MDRDCEFLEQENIMDYSLLVGVHFRDTRDRLLTGGWLKQNCFNNLIYGYDIPYKVHCHIT